MRSPEEIYKSLKVCATENDCRNCGYKDINGSDCVNELMKDALEYIKQLKARIAHLEGGATE